jgi:hypothetical protein
MVIESSHLQVTVSKTVSRFTRRSLGEGQVSRLP